MLTVGTQAPDFSLLDGHNNTIKLSELLKKHIVVIFFYPKDLSPGCTKQSCAFRDNTDGFKQLNAEIIGISQDSSETHTRFANKHGLAFSLLTDPGSAIAKRYGVTKTLGIIPGRVTFVIDQKGIIQFAYSSQTDVMGHAAKALEAVKKLAS